MAERPRLHDLVVALPHVRHAALLLADLDDPVRVLPWRRRATSLRLGERVRERLLDVDVLARVEGIGQHLDVPVVGAGDDHGLDVLVVEHLAIVLRPGRLRVRPGQLQRLLGRDVPDVADRDDLEFGEELGGLQQLAAPPPRADRADPEGLVGPRGRGRAPRQAQRQAGRGRGRQEVASRAVRLVGLDGHRALLVASRRGRGRGRGYRQAKGSAGAGQASPRSSCSGEEGSILKAGGIPADGSEKFPESGPRAMQRICRDGTINAGRTDEWKDEAIPRSGCPRLATHAIVPVSPRPGPGGRRPGAAAWLIVSVGEMHDRLERHSRAAGPGLRDGRGDRRAGVGADGGAAVLEARQARAGPGAGPGGRRPRGRGPGREGRGGHRAGPRRGGQGPPQRRARRRSGPTASRDEFHVVVFGTGSAGKTSLINALLGQAVGTTEADDGDDPPRRDPHPRDRGGRGDGLPDRHPRPLRDRRRGGGPRGRGPRPGRAGRPAPVRRRPRPDPLRVRAPGGPGQAGEAVDRRPEQERPAPRRRPRRDPAASSASAWPGSCRRPTSWRSPPAPRPTPVRIAGPDGTDADRPRARARRPRRAPRADRRRPPARGGRPPRGQPAPPRPPAEQGGPGTARPASATARPRRSSRSSSGSPPGRSSPTRSPRSTCWPPARSSSR